MNQPPIKMRDLDWAALVRQREGEAYNAKEVVYEFSNGREFKSTDSTDSGIYE
jgi:hypothetical protein